MGFAIDEIDHLFELVGMAGTLFRFWCPFNGICRNQILLLCFLACFVLGI